MASPSPPLLMILKQDTAKEAATTHSEPPKIPRGRKPSKSRKSPSKKKPSQRGMGVERLERLRLQGKWGSNMPEIGSFPPHQQFPQAPPLIPATGYYVGSELNRSSSFMAPPKVSPLGGVVVSSGNVTRDWVGGLLETSSKVELSSTPKVQHRHCESCFSEKKCMNMEEMGLVLGGKDKLIPNVVNCHLLTGWNHGHNSSSIGMEMKDFNHRTVRPIYHKEEEMMGMTRQAWSVKEYEFFPLEKNLREYEFFPGTSSGRSRTTSEQPEPASSHFYYIPSDHHQYNAAPSNAIDLSLKL